MIISRNLAQVTLLEPLNLDVNELYIVSGYATPNMVSWYFMCAGQYLRDMHLDRELSVNLIVGMTAQEGMSLSDHEGFKELVEETFDEHIVSFTCNYVYQTPSVHSKVYIWAKDGAPVKAFIGSANFSQTAFSNRRREVLSECDATSAMNYYNEIEVSSIYCTHGEIEEYIILRPTHAMLR